VEYTEEEQEEEEIQRRSSSCSQYHPGVSDHTYARCRGRRCNVGRVLVLNNPPATAIAFQYGKIMFSKNHASPLAMLAMPPVLRD